MSDSTASSGDKAGKAHWDREWTGRALPGPVDPRSRGIRHHALRAFHREFVRAFDGADTNGLRLLEIGCARSAWLPYFAREFGFRVTGLDYSEIGCSQEREVLARAGVPGEVVCANLFEPPGAMVGAFDVVVSLGVIEHFSDTASALRACARYLRPGGRMVTEIPNMRGLPGWVTRITDRPIYDIHVPLDTEELSSAHREAGLQVRWSNYILPVDWSVFGFGRITRPWLRWPAMGAAFALAGTVWVLDERGLAPRPNSITSPYLFCVADKP